MAENLKIVGYERCTNLTSKGMFVETEHDPDLPRGDSGLFWCSLTQTCLGPDGGIVDDRQCKPDRSCYESM